MTACVSVDQLLGGQQLVALGVGHHQAVLDTVVHHLGVMPGADRAGVDESVGHVARRACRRLEDRHRLAATSASAAADHQAVAFGQAPDTTGDTGVDERNSLVRQQLRVRTVLGVARVTAVDRPRSPALSTSASAAMVLGAVTGPDGTITHTTRGVTSASARAARVGTSVTSGLRVVADHLVSAFAQALRAC